ARGRRPRRRRRLVELVAGGRDVAGGSSSSWPAAATSPAARRARGRRPRRRRRLVELVAGGRDVAGGSSSSWPAAATSPAARRARGRLGLSTGWAVTREVVDAWHSISNRGTVERGPTRRLGGAPLLSVLGQFSGAAHGSPHRPHRIGPASATLTDARILRPHPHASDRPLFDDVRVLPMPPPSPPTPPLMTTDSERR